MYSLNIDKERRSYFTKAYLMHVLMTYAKICISFRQVVLAGKMSWGHFKEKYLGILYQSI